MLRIFKMLEGVMRRKEQQGGRSDEEECAMRERQRGGWRNKEERETRRKERGGVRND